MWQPKTVNKEEEGGRIKSSSACTFNPLRVQPSMFPESHRRNSNSSKRIAASPLAVLALISIFVVSIFARFNPHMYVNAPRRSAEAVNHLVSRNNPSGNFVEEEAPSSLALVEAFEPESAEENETNSNDNGNRVILHVGPHKTGSTAIQSSLNLEVYHGSLASDNYILLPGEQRGHLMKRVLQNCFNGKCPNGIIQQLQKAKNNSQNIVISSEQLDFYRPIEKIQTFFKDFNTIQVVVSYRRFFEWVPSQYSQERRRGDWLNWYSQGNTPDNFVTFIAKKGIQGLYKNERYSINVYNNYRDHFNISWLNFHDGDIVESFFCSVLNASHTCSVKKTQNVAVINNTSPTKHLAYDEIVAAAYDEGLINGTVTRNDARFFLDKYQQKHMSGVTAFPTICLPEETLKELLSVSMEAEREYLSSHSTVAEQKGEDELLRKFETMKSENAFCSVNTTHVLADPKWRKAFAEMMLQ